MSYNSRTNFADPEELPIEEFLKVFTHACKVGWENMKNNPPKFQCQWHGEPCISDDKGQCICQATVQTAIVDSTDKLQPVLLCEYHAKKLSKILGVS